MPSIEREYHVHQYGKLGRRYMLGALASADSAFVVWKGEGRGGKGSTMRLLQAGRKEIRTSRPQQMVARVHQRCLASSEPHLSVSTHRENAWSRVTTVLDLSNLKQSLQQTQALHTQAHTDKHYADNTAWHILLIKLLTAIQQTWAS